MAATGCCSNSWGSRSAAQLRQHGQQFLIVRYLIERIYLGEYDLSLLVDDECRPFANSWQGRILAENAECLRHSSVRVKIGTHWQVHRTNVVFLPSHVAVNRIYTDVQDLGIELGELLAIAIERRNLVGSGGRPVHRVKGYDHMLLVAIITQSDTGSPLSFHRRQLKIRSHLPHFQSHAFSLLRDFTILPAKHEGRPLGRPRCGFRKVD